MKTNIVITLKEEYVDTREEIAAQFQKEGLEIIKVLSSGVIIGNASNRKTLSKILLHKEIEAPPEQEAWVKISPPDSKIQ